MKKAILSIFTLIVILLGMPKVLASEKVPVYVFTKNGCSACQKAFQYFDDLQKKNPDLFDQYIIEVYDGKWNVKEDSLYDILIATLTRLNGDTVKIATPTIVIGDYLSVGLNNQTEIYNKIVEAQEKPSDEKVDIVKEEADKLGVDLEKYKKVPEETSSLEIIIIVGIFVILIGGFVGIIVISKK